MPYTPREYAEMHFIYGFCNGNARHAAREYANRYPNRVQHPDYRVFILVHNAYVEGRIPGMPKREGRPQHVPEEAVLRQIEENPALSVRRISENTGVARTTVHRILRRELLHPFHIQRVQALLPEDYPKRVQFCREMLRRSRENPQYFNSILWTDEANFRRTGVFNIHNMHYWAVENPRIIRDHHFQHQFGVNLWAGIMNGAIIGPFELPARLRGPDYLNFLQNDLPNLLENVPLAIRAHMWFQHDGAPAHSTRVVRQFLDATFPERWIGRGGTIQWPPRSPDLNPLDFFLMGVL